MAASDTSEKLEGHLKLLKEEYTKLQRNYAELERKYCKAAAALGEKDLGEFSSFVSRLIMTVATLYGRKTYSDVTIRLNDKTIPAHKFVLNARSEVWSEEELADINVLDWSDLESDIGYALLRWLYTDIIDLQHDSLALGLLRASHRFQLPGLLGLCERALVSSVGVRSCVRFYCVAEEVGAYSLLEYCSGLISTNWDDLTPQDFEHMTSPLLYKMLKTKSDHPLHVAVRLMREDVVFLCLVENDDSLYEVANGLSEQGQLPLGIALMSRSTTIANTLIQNGKADVNAYNGEGCTLLIDAIKRGDGFAAQFLLEKDCDVNLMSKIAADTALHLASTYSQKSCDLETFNDMVMVAETLIQKGADPNMQNSRGYTSLHLAIMSGNTKVVEELLRLSNLDTNIRTNDDKCALQFALMPPFTTGPPFDLASKLIEKGARSNQNNAENGDSILQLLIKNKLEDAAIFLSRHTNVNFVNRSGLTALHLACQFSLAKLVDALLENGASPNMQSSIGEMKTALHFAVENKSVDVIQVFVNFRKNAGVEKPDFNLKTIDGDAPLCLALMLDAKELVPVLIQGGADVNVRNGQDLTLLHQSILKEDAETAVFLLNQGADYNALTGDQESPLQLAIHCRLPKVVDELCTLGVSFSSPNSKGDSPLWSALESEQDEIASVLVRHGVDIDCWSSTGPEGCLQTLLHRAINENRESAAMFLIRSRCDLDSPRQTGLNGEGDNKILDKASPLHLCCQWGLVQVLKTLIDHGANVNAVDSLNRTPLHTAIENQHEEIIMILLCHPSINLKIRDKAGNTCFAAALTFRNHKAAQAILERLPTAAEQMDKRGRNFLHVAIMKDDLESVLFLLSIQVDVNSRVHDVNQTAPLHLAAVSKNEMLLRNLILAGARINDKDATSKTALHIACERGNLPAVSALLQNGADYDVVDSDGNNALHIAVRESNLSVVRELLTESRVNAEAINLKGRNPLHELCRSGKDNVAAAIIELFLECMPKYPINTPELQQGNTPLLLAFMRGQAPLCKVLVKNGACLGAENKDGVTIFNYKLATNQLLLKLLDQLPQESPWATSELCQECGTKFTITMRKHHCRHCGRILCSKCSNNDIPILKFNINKPVRVCCVCFEVLQMGSD